MWWIEKSGAKRSGSEASRLPCHQKVNEACLRPDRAPVRQIEMDSEL
jgi:hypothetical protein